MAVNYEPGAEWNGKLLPYGAREERPERQTCSYCAKPEYQRVEQRPTGEVIRCTVCGETRSVSQVSATALLDRFKALVTNRRKTA